VALDCAGFFSFCKARLAGASTGYVTEGATPQIGKKTGKIGQLMDDRPLSYPIYLS
jgi:hypothetical protein